MKKMIIALTICTAISTSSFAQTAATKAGSTTTQVNQQTAAIEGSAVSDQTTATTRKTKHHKVWKSSRANEEGKNGLNPSMGNDATPNSTNPNFYNDPKHATAR